MRHIDSKDWAYTLLPWLLEARDPSIRYRTLVDLLELPAQDEQVQASQAAIPAHPPVAALLAAQKPAGCWVGRDYYIPKHFSTFWVLGLLADLGLTRENEHISIACEHMFSFQRPDGQFCRRRRIARQGEVWDTQAEPCTQARIVRFLIQFGYGEDPRTRLALDWLIGSQRSDSMWMCRSSRGRGCLRATLDYLRAAVLIPPVAVHPATARAAAAVCELLLQPNMGRYHVGEEWTELIYPYFGYGLIPALDSLARLGYKPNHPKIAPAVSYLLSRQLPGGSWLLDAATSRCPLDFGQPGAPNKWLTLDALRLFKRLGVLAPLAIASE
jgi:hypothetical protein